MRNTLARRVGATIAGGIGMIAMLGAFASPAAAVPPQPAYKVTVTKTQNNKVDFRRKVGSCTLQNPGTCTIGVVKSVSTTVQVQAGVSVGWVSSQISFSTSASSSTSANCTSGTLKRNQTWSAFAIGTGKYYTISKKVGSTWQQVGGINYAWQPHTYPDIWCGIY